jgi:hypothetical protein
MRNLKERERQSKADGQGQSVHWPLNRFQNLPDTSCPCHTEAAKHPGVSPDINERPQPQ